MTRSRSIWATREAARRISAASDACRWLLRGLAPLILTLAVAASAGAIDLGDLAPYAGRLPRWDTTKAGVQGGIPNTTDAAKWPVCQGGACDLSPNPTPTQVQAAINQAAKGCGGTEGCVVEVPPGTTTFGTGNGNAYIDMPSNVLLRGSGAEGSNATHFKGNGPHKDTVANPQGLSGIVTFSGTRVASGISVQDSSFPKGKKTFTLAGTANILPGYVLMITTNTTNFSWMENPGTYGGLGGPKFTARVTSVSGKQVTVDRGILWDLTPSSPSNVTADVFDPVENSGVENIHFDMTSLSSSDSSGHGQIVFLSAINCWVRGSFVEHGNMNEITQDVPAMNISIVGNKIGVTQHFIRDPAANADSYPIVHRSYGLTANNVFVGSNIQGFFGKYEANANVYAYNYAYASARPNSKYGHRIFFHGRGPHNNLVEGNYSADNIIRYGENFWGPQGVYNTFYRNRVRDISVENNSDRTIALFPNLIGNSVYRMWQSLYCGVDEDKYLSGVCGGGSDVDVNVNNGLYLYNLATDAVSGEEGRGFVMISPSGTSDCGGGPGKCSGGDAPHGTNIEGTDRGSNWSGLKMPSSLFFESRQDWELRTGATWCAEACPFDDVFSGIGAFGDRDPAMDGSFAGSCKLPAQIRAEGGTCTSLGGSSPPPPPATLPAPYLLP